MAKKTLFDELIERSLSGKGLGDFWQVVRRKAKENLLRSLPEDFKKEFSIDDSSTIEEIGNAMEKKTDSLLKALPDDFKKREGLDKKSRFIDVYKASKKNKNSKDKNKNKGNFP